MNDLNANEIESGSIIQTDVCIVGGGAAGIAIAQALLGTSHDVLVMESGSLERDDKTQSLAQVRSAGFPVRAKNEDGLDARLRCLGGSTNIWGGRCAQLSRIDFQERSWVNDSGWPISYEELSPYYTQAAQLLKVPTIDPPSMQGDEIRSCSHNILQARQFSFANRPVNMKLAYADAIRKSTNARICLQANCVHIQPTQNQCMIEQMRFKTLAGNSFVVKARVFILACGGWENARLLLASRHGSDAGIGNRFDNVGRYLMDHPILAHGHIKLNSPARKRANLLCPTRVPGGYVKYGIGMTAELQGREGLLNHYIDLIPVLDPGLEGLPYARRSLSKLLHISPRRLVTRAYWRQFGQGASFLLSQNFGVPHPCREIAVINHLEHAPNRESRVYLSGRRDSLGLPKLNIDLRISSQEIDSLTRYHRWLSKAIPMLGYGEFHSSLENEMNVLNKMTDAFHHMGTTRMSRDARNGVVDRNCRVHGIENLFVAGSSVFPTGGCVNPTLTIVALSLRLAEFVKHVTQPLISSQSAVTPDLKTSNLNALPMFCR